MESKFGSTVVKASFGGQIRKWRLNSGVKHADLLNSVRNEFGIGSSNLRLKYKDSDGDHIELASDEDLALAIESETKLVIFASSDSDDLPKTVADFRSTLSTLIANATELFNSLDQLSLPDKRSSPIQRDNAFSSGKISPIKHESVATIDPSVLEEVQLNDASNGIQDLKPPMHGNGIQSYQPMKGLNEPIGFGAQQHSSLNQIPAPPISAPSNLPPTSNFVQPPHHQQYPPSSGFNNLPPQQFAPPSSLAGMPPIASQPQQHMNHVPQPTSVPSHLPPTSNYGQPPQHQQYPPSSGFNSLPPQQFAPPPQGMPPTAFGAQQYQQIPPKNDYGQPLQKQMPPPMQSGQQNPFQRPPSMTPNQTPLPPTGFGQQHDQPQMHY